MEKIRIGVFGFGKTGKVIANEFLKDSFFTLAWVVRKSHKEHQKYASRLLGYEFDAGNIFSVEDIGDDFFLERPVDALVDFSDSTGIHLYARAAKAGIPIISAISKYEQKEFDLLKSFAEFTSVLLFSKHYFRD